MNKNDMVPCPYCGEMIRKKAKACPHCGSDERAGWSDDTYLDGIDLGDDFDYDALVEEEFSGSSYSGNWWKSWKTLTGILLLVLFLLFVLRYLL